MIKKLLLASSFLIVTLGCLQAQQGFFLNSWKPKNIIQPEYNDTVPVSGPANVSITIHCKDTLTKIPIYIFGDNANVYTSSMSENKTLMKYLSDRKMGVLRGPSGSISDVYFWNRSPYQVPTDVPDTLLSGGSGKNWEWYGKQPDSWAAGWTMDIDSFYSILNQTGVTGLLTMNYGYARYGTSANPVAQAAHLAADRVRYDKGRTKFWEIGNEVNGSWEAGYRIDTSLNKDGQPEYINGTLYGQHCRVFVDSMRAAALETGAEIFIGAVAGESASSDPANWNINLMKAAGDVIDFYIVHSYYTPWQQNSTAPVILSCPTQTSSYISYLDTCSTKAGVPMHPVALTEYNLQAIGSKQMVSQVAGMFAVLVVGEAIKAGIGEASRWDLANGYGTGDDMGMYSYGNEPGVTLFAPRPAFYYLYYMQKFLGDVMLNNTIKGTPDITAYSSSFSSGQIGTIVVNKGLKNQIVRINVENGAIGNRYYTYTLVGGTDVPSNPQMPFSRKVIVNGSGPSGVAGGPSNYESIKAKSTVIGGEILLQSPPFSTIYLLIDSGSNQIATNDTVCPAIHWNNPPDIVYGSLLSSTQLNATADIPGKFTYSPKAASLLNAGTGIKLQVLFVPTDTSVYSPVITTVKINVYKATPVINWNSPADIAFGTLLGDSQLNANANVDGVFLYNPPSGTLLDTGSNQILKTTFIPSDTLDYNTLSKSVAISVYSTTGIMHIPENEVSIYPVPVSDELVLSNLSTFGERDLILTRVISAEGTVVYSTSLKNTGIEQTINLSKLPAGIYLLHLFTADKSIIKRFVKY
jgi:Secretion system C-terminal sorting domain